MSGGIQMQRFETVQGSRAVVQFALNAGRNIKAGIRELTLAPFALRQGRLVFGRDPLSAAVGVKTDPFPLEPFEEIERRWR